MRVALAFLAWLAGAGVVFAQVEAPPPQNDPPAQAAPDPAPRTQAPRIILAPQPQPTLRPRQAAPELPPPPTDLPAAVTEDDIAVTSDYRGFRVTVFGVNPDRRGRGDVVVALRGPNTPAIVRKKRRFLGLWVNGDPVRFNEAPAFFAVYSARPLYDIANPQAVGALQLDAAAAARLAGPTPPDASPSDYRQALVRLRSASGLYINDPRGLRMLGAGLFRAQIQIPANAPIGQYQAEVYLFREGRLVSSQESIVMVSRQGLERTIHDLALGIPWLYGLAVVIFALSAGYGAAFLFRRA